MAVVLSDELIKRSPSVVGVSGWHSNYTNAIHANTFTFISFMIATLLSCTALQLWVTLLWSLIPVLFTSANFRPSGQDFSQWFCKTFFWEYCMNFRVGSNPKQSALVLDFGTAHKVYMYSPSPLLPFSITHYKSCLHVRWCSAEEVPSLWMAVCRLLFHPFIKLHQTNTENGYFFLPDSFICCTNVFFHSWGQKALRLVSIEHAI